MPGIPAVLLGTIAAMFGLGMLGVAAAPTPDPEAEPEAEIAACERTCNESDDETDRETCKLNCRQKSEAKDRVNIIRWTEERHVGGTVPGQDAPPPPVTTVTKVTPRGTTVETNAPPAPVATPPAVAPSAPATPRQRYYFGLVGCQDRCNGLEDLGRARCKLQCLRQQPGPPPPATAVAPAAPGPRPSPAPAAAATPVVRTPAVAPSTTAVDCKARCASEATEDDRMTCEATCDYAEQRKQQPTTGQQTTTITTRPAECRRLCSEREARCKASCGSNDGTCRVQCEESANACDRRCG